MTLVLALPVFIPLLCGATAVLARRRPPLQIAIAFAGASGLLVTSSMCLITTLRTGPFALQFGDWPAPFGITFVADILSSAMVTIAGLIGLSAIFYACSSNDVSPERAPLFLPLLLLMLGGIAGAFLTGDLFNLYVWFEVMLVASFGLLAIGNRPHQLSGTMKYVVLNVIATTILLIAIAMMYGAHGTLNLADLAVRASQTDVENSTAAALFAFAFFVKAATFPLYFWLPPAYPNSSIVVSAALAGLLTKVGVYGLYRIMTLVFADDLRTLSPVFAVIAGLTMLTGVLGAVASSEMRTIFSFHIVSQIGYMIMPLAFPSAAALSAGVFYVIHHILVKSNLFFISGLIARAGGSSDLTRIRGGLLGTHHGLALFFAIPAASLAGIPPLSGFWAKLVVIDIGLQAHQGALVTIALITSALTLFSMTKIWQAAFWGEARSAAREETPRSDLDPSFDVPAPRVSAWSYTPVVVLALLTVSIGLWPEPLLRLTTRAGIELTDHTDYIDAVMRTRP